MTDRYLLVRKDGQPAQIPAGDAVKLRGALNQAPQVSNGAAATMSIGAATSDSIYISGSGTRINSFGTGTDGMRRQLQFAAGVILSAGLNTPGAADIITLSGDNAEVQCAGGSSWRFLSYTRANGAALVSSGSASTYTFTQSTALATWTIAHNLNRRPSVTVVDTLENVVVPDVSYVDANTIQINFGAAFAGKAYLN